MKYPRSIPVTGRDVPGLVADVHRTRDILNWSPRHDDLRTIINTALERELKLPESAAC